MNGAESLVRTLIDGEVIVCFVTIVIFASRAYWILFGELSNVGGGTPGRNANDMLMLDRPALDWVRIAKAYGVEAGRATTLDELALKFKHGLASAEPYLMELVM